MVNTDIKKSFIIHDPSLNARPEKIACKNAETMKAGDVVFLENSSGKVTSTYHASNSQFIAGVCASNIIDGYTGDINDTAATASEDYVLVYTDPYAVFKAQISTFTATDPVTTGVSAGCYDIAGSAGAQYINAAASSNDTIRVLGLSSEYDTGVESAVGASAKVFCQMNPQKHFRAQLS